MQDHVEGSTLERTHLRQMDKHVDESSYYTNFQDKSFSSRYLSHGIEQIVENASRQSHGMEQVVENVSRHSHSIEQMVENVPRHSHCIEQLVDNAARHRHSIEQIVDNASRHNHGIEQLVNTVSRHSHGIEQIVDGGPRHSHGIDQIVDGGPRHNVDQIMDNVSRQNHTQQCLTNITYQQQQHLKDTSSVNEIQFYSADGSKSTSLTMLGFPLVNVIEKQTNTREIQGINVEPLLNLSAYSPAGLHTPNDYTAMKGVMLTSVDGPSNASEFKVKDTGLTILSNLAQSRSPITEQAEEKKTEGQHSVQFSCGDLVGIPDSNVPQVLDSHMIIRNSQNKSAEITNLRIIGCSLSHDNHPTLGKQHSLSNEVVDVAMEPIPYISKDSSIQCKAPLTDDKVKQLKFDTHDRRNIDTCEEEPNFFDMFHCGACSLLFGTLCNLHSHLEHQHCDGSYVYDRTTKTAYPKFKMVNVAIQTSSEDADEDDMFHIDREECSDALPTPSGHVLDPESEEAFSTCTTSTDGYTVSQQISSNSEATSVVVVDGYKYDINGIDEENEHDMTDDHSNEKSEEELCAINGSEEGIIKPHNCKEFTESEIDVDVKEKDFSPSIKKRKLSSKVGKCEVSNRKMIVTKEIKNQLGVCQQINKKVSNPSKRKLPGTSKLKSTSLDKKKDVPKLPISCSLCGENFTLAFHLKTHSEKVHGIKKSYSCKTCSTSCKSLEELKEHRLLHKKQIHQCEICDKVVSTAASLRDHRNFHMGVKPHKCKLCSKQFRTTGQMNAHIREKHESDFNQQCEVCGKTFTSRHRMREHKKQCQDIKPHKCEFCDKRFIRTTQLRVHVRTHTGEKPYICDICGCALTNYSSLIKHKRIHTGEKPYECDQCSQAFTAKTTLNDHKRIHTQDKRFHCTYCDRSFIKKWNLKTHLRQHTGETPYTCSICGQGYKQNVLLKTHMQSHNKNELMEGGVEDQIQAVNYIEII